MKLILNTFFFYVSKVRDTGGPVLVRGRGHVDGRRGHEDGQQPERGTPERRDGPAAGTRNARSNAPDGLQYAAAATTTPTAAAAASASSAADAPPTATADTAAAAAPPPDEHAHDERRPQSATGGCPSAQEEGPEEEVRDDSHTRGVSFT